MAQPSWLVDTFAVIMLVIAAYCAARLLTSLLARREIELDADVVHLVMGISMAGMLISRLNPIPNGVWEAAFALAAVWFAARTVRAWRGSAAKGWLCPHPLPHLVESLAMVYMLLAAQGTAPGGAGKRMAMGGMAGMSGVAGMGEGSGGMARFPALALLLAVFMIGYVVWLGDGLAPAGPAPVRCDAPTTGDAAAPGTGRTFLAPRLATCYKIAMGITMGYMLVMMV